MCPFCFASLALIVSDTISTGGLMALCLQGFRKSRNNTVEKFQDEENHETREDTA